MSLTSDYVADHLRHVDSIDPNWGKAIAELVLNKTIDQLGDEAADGVSVPLSFSVASYDLQQCVQICVGDGHGKICTHIGIRL